MLKVFVSRNFDECEVMKLPERNTRKLRKDAIQNQNIIMQEAHKLFTKNGIDNVSMHQIAKAAGVGQGTLYRRYANKGELCLDLMLDIADKNCNKILNYLQEHHADPVEVKLDKVLAYSLDFIEEQCLWLSAIKAPNCEDDQTLIYHSPIYKSRHDIFCKLLEEVPCKDNSYPLDMTYTADLIMAALAPNLFLFLRDDRGYSKDKIRGNLYNLCLKPLFK